MRIKRKFDYLQVDVMGSDQQQWKSLYEFDAPVVGVTPFRNEAQLNPRLKLHVQRVFPFNTKVPSPNKPLKLMHRFDEREVAELIDEAEGKS